MRSLRKVIIIGLIALMLIIPPLFSSFLSIQVNNNSTWQVGNDSTEETILSSSNDFAERGIIL